MTFLMIDDGSFESFLTAIWLHVLAAESNSCVSVLHPADDAMIRVIGMVEADPDNVRFFYTANEINGVSTIERVLKSGMPLDSAVFYIGPAHLRDVKANGMPEIKTEMVLRFFHIMGSYPISEDSALTYLIYSRGPKDELIPVIADWVRTGEDGGLWDWIEGASYDVPV